MRATEGESVDHGAFSLHFILGKETLNQEPNGTEMSAFARTIMEQKYSHDKTDGTKETWAEIARRVAKHVLGAVGAPKSLVDEVAMLIEQRKFIPAGRYLYASGRPLHQVQNCLLLRAEDSREGWADLMHKATMALMTGAGIGVDYSDVRARGTVIRKTGGFATGPISLMQMLNEAGRGIMQGGSRRSAIWAGLSWSHPDIMEFITLKNWMPEVRSLKERDFNFPATMDGTNVSVQLDDEFFTAYHNDKHKLHAHAHSVYWTTIRQMLKTGEPGFSIDTGANKRETLRNACTEVTTEDDSDICNLGSINMARIESLEEMRRVVELGTYFLMAGTRYSDVPYPKVDEVRTKNRRLGLGLMGLHEWLLLRGLPYAPSDELGKYLEIYATSGDVANKIADEWGVSRPVKTRAIAPTGTIGIIGETTTGIEPIFCVAFKRRYAKGSIWNYQYVIDPTAKKLIDNGVNPDNIEDAYTLSEDGGKRRVEFQAWLQRYVDHSISSTINLPVWGSEFNNDSRVQDFGRMLIQYLPSLRGITVYPDGARGGQPLNPIKYATAIKHIGEIFVEAVDICDITKGGSCGA
jgi:ribonucleoside-diphosphate reductase alpha chain